MCQAAEISDLRLWLSVRKEKPRESYGQVLVEKFKYFKVLFTSKSKREREIDRHVSARPAVMRTLYWSVVVKKNLSHMANLPVYVCLLSLLPQKFKHRTSRN